MAAKICQTPGCARPLADDSFDHCAFCLNGYVPPRLVGVARWKNGRLIRDDGTEVGR